MMHHPDSPGETLKSRSEPRVVIFGNQRSAQLARYCLEHDSPWEVAGFTVDAAYRDGDAFDGLPIVDFETLDSAYPPGEVRLLIPAGYQRINGLRRSRYEAAKARGYGFVSYRSSRASLWPDLRLGENCLVYEHAIVQPFATIGDNVIVRSGAHVSHHCRVDSHAFISVEAVIAGAVHVGEQAFIGVGAVLRDRLRIAPRSFIGAGAVVVHDTEEGAAYVGNPARRIERPAHELC
jgi:sugar O-acyltransferase (sialic acid O-acetyltransferase NeuD family)